MQSDTRANWCKSAASRGINREISSSNGIARNKNQVAITILVAALPHDRDTTLERSTTVLVDIFGHFLRTLVYYRRVFASWLAGQSQRQSRIQ